jgi:bacterioferritin
MASEKLLELLNAGIRRELQVSVQYMWQHVLAKGIESPPIRDILKEIAITEMKHAEDIAERIDYLGGKPTTKVDPINVGESLEEMIKLDLEAEAEAIQLYRETIETAMEEKDYTTVELFLKILAEEEEHHNEFQTLLE